jgi:hypothetical protein
MVESRQTAGTKRQCFSVGSDKICSDECESVGHITDLNRSVAWRGQRSIVDRFWSKVNKFGPLPSHCPDLGHCWIWTGCVASRYGQISLGHPSTPGSKRWRAHRFSWELHNGPIADPNLRVCHRCDNCLCVNPAHLTLQTQAWNVHDSSQKGRKNAWGIQKLNADDVRVIRQQAERGLFHKDIAKAFGIARNTVSGIVHRKSWAHLP